MDRIKNEATRGLAHVRLRCSQKGSWMQTLELLCRGLRGRPEMRSINVVNEDMKRKKRMQSKGLNGENWTLKEKDHSRNYVSSFKMYLDNDITKYSNITFTDLISRSQDVSLGHLNKYNIVICDFFLLDQFVPASQAFLISAVIFRNNETQK